MAIKKMPIGLFMVEARAALNRHDGYIMGATGQNPKNWSKGSWWFTQYSGTQKTKALYWRDHAARVWDCNGLSEGIYKDFSGVSINTMARYNYANWCGVKGKGMIPTKYRVPGAAVFWGKGAASIHHVAYLDKPVVAGKPDGDWYIIEARGVMYGVVQTRLYARKPNFWGLMDKYYDYSNTNSIAPEPVKPGSRTLRQGDTGEDVKALQNDLLALGYALPQYGTDGDYGTETVAAVKAFQKEAGLDADGETGPMTWAALEAAIDAAEKRPDIDPVKPAADILTVKNGSWNLRTGPGTDYPSAQVAHGGDKLPEIETGNFVPVQVDDRILWISKKAVM